jgi:hypothetical protein
MGQKSVADLRQLVIGDFREKCVPDDIRNVTILYQATG